MSDQRTSIPWLPVALDVFGTVLLVLGILGLTGMDLGFPVLRTVAPGFVILGVLLMVPLLVWVVRKGAAKV